MIVNIIHTSRSDNAVRYNHRKLSADSGLLLDTNCPIGIGANLAEHFYWHNQEAQASLNSKMEKPGTHIILAFSPDDREKLNDERLLEMAHETLKRLGYSHSPFAIYRHDDTAHPHIHIVTSKYTLSDDASAYKRVKTSNDRYHAKELRKQFELKYNLTPTGKTKSEGKDWKEHQAERNSNNLVKAEIRKIVFRAIQDKPDMDTLARRLLREDITIKPALNSNGIYGLSFEKDGLAFKGSQLAKTLSWEKLKPQVNLINFDLARIQAYGQVGKLASRLTEADRIMFKGLDLGNAYTFTQGLRAGGNPELISKGELALMNPALRIALEAHLAQGPKKGRGVLSGQQALNDLEKAQRGTTDELGKHSQEF